MFGYVNISCSSIKEEDKKLYLSYYCGLCKAIAAKNQIARIGLNNDLTFLSVLLSGIYQEEPEFKKDLRCAMHGFRKHDEVIINDVLDYTSDMNIFLVYLKLCDDISDENKLSGITMKPIFKKSYKNILKKYPVITKKAEESLIKLSVIEKKNCSLIDEVADCFGKLLETIFVPDFISDENTRKILSWIGYNIGRWIYIADAYEDMEKDKKKDNYNPLLLANYKNSEELKEDIYNSMTYSLVNIANAYDLLDIKRNDTLIRNILYAGLPQRQELIFNKTEGNNGSL